MLTLEQFTTTVVGFVIIYSFVIWAQLIIDQYRTNLYNKYLRPLKVEDGRIAEEEQENDPGNDSDPPDKESDSGSDSGSHSDPPDKESEPTNRHVSFKDDDEIIDNSVDELDRDDLENPIREGDFITFKFYVNNVFLDNPDIGVIGVMRSITTYAQCVIQPYDICIVNGCEEPQIYYVVRVHSDIPNMKGGNPKINLDIKNRIHLQVYPVEDNDIDKFNNQSDLDVYTGVFWFINYTDMAVCQYEDGCQLDRIECITVIQRDTTYNDYIDDDYDDHDVFDYDVDCRWGPDYNFNDGDW